MLARGCPKTGMSSISMTKLLSKCWLECAGSEMSLAKEHHIPKRIWDWDTKKRDPWVLKELKLQRDRLHSHQTGTREHLAAHTWTIETSHATPAHKGAPSPPIPPHISQDSADSHKANDSNSPSWTLLGSPAASTQQNSYTPTANSFHAPRSYKLVNGWLHLLKSSGGTGREKTQIAAAPRLRLVHNSQATDL